MRKILLILALLLLCISFASAAELKGTIYNSQLELQTDAIVEINTEPKQSFVSKDGTYSFNVPNGEYTLTAKYMNGNEIDLYAEEKISVAGGGAYTLDIILFDYLEEQEPVDFDITDELSSNRNAAAYLGIALLAFLVAASFFVVFFLRKKARRLQQHIENELKTDKKESVESNNDLDKIISIIKKEGGRTTQLEIRKHIPLSEAKISLMIAELEDKGIVRKIKKGRGNIIILNK